MRASSILRDFQPAGAGGGANYVRNNIEGPDCLSSVGECVEPVDYAPPVAFYDHLLFSEISMFWVCSRTTRIISCHLTENVRHSFLDIRFFEILW